MCRSARDGPDKVGGRQGKGELVDLADDLHEKGGNERATLKCVADCAWTDDGYFARERCRCATSAEMEELVVDASVRRRQR